jgi:hypothetical protein
VFRRLDRAKTLALPFEEDFPQSLMMHALHQYLSQFLDQLYEKDQYVPHSTCVACVPDFHAHKYLRRIIAREVIARMLGNRYEPLMGNPPKGSCMIRNPDLDLPEPPSNAKPEISICGSRSYKLSPESPVVATFPVEVLARKFQPAVDRLLDVFDLDSPTYRKDQPLDQRKAVRDIHVHNYIEETVDWLVGPDHVYDYLRCCF